MLFFSMLLLAILIVAQCQYQNITFSYCNVSTVEVDALHDLYISANGNNWLWTSVGGSPWNFDVSHPNPCSWQGVFCDFLLNYFNGSQFNCTVVNLQLEFRNLSGTIPDSISNLTHLGYLQLYNNSLMGTIPHTIGNLKKLVILSLSDNGLTGTIPTSFKLLNDTLEYLYLYNNSLIGEIPAWLLTGFKHLEFIDLMYNYFSGSLPPIDLPNLAGIRVDSNMLTGVPPASLCNNSNLEYYTFSYNGFSGTIPWCSSKVFSYLDASYNEFTGTLSTFPSIDLEYLMINNNLLTGTIPNKLTLSTLMYQLQMNDNIFSGTLPTPNEYLQFLYVQNNGFTGSFAPLMQSLSSGGLLYLDVSNNEITGSIPEELFTTFPQLISFASTSNCITGTIPKGLCDLSSLIYLGLDGLGTAQSCRYPFFSEIPQFTSFSLKNQITGGIPHCLFNISTLETIHLSGNSIEWSFPSDLVVSKSIVSASLSHNKITGTIPDSIQLKAWNNLDLSYNKLVGIIHSKIALGDNSTLVLQVNRLSGSIPNSLTSLPSINILTGNLFSCDLRRHGLPVNDDAYSIYQCGSNSFNQASIMWCTCAGIGICLLASAFATSRQLMSARWIQILEKWNLYMKVFENEKGNQRMYAFRLFVLTVRDFVVYLTIGILVVFLPLYAALTHYYKTAEYQYAWTVSAAFLAGFSPAIVLLIFYLLFICILFGAWLFLVNKPAISDEAEKHSVVQSNWKQKSCLTAVVILNCVVMSLVNGAYVIIILTYDTQVIFAAQVFIALFKLLWNDFAVRGMMLFAREYHTTPEEALMMTASRNSSGSRTASSERSRSDSTVKDILDDIFVLQEMPYMAFIVLFNSIIAPCLATAAVDSNCFFNVFIAPSTVTSLFPIITSDYSCFGLNGTYTHCTNGTTGLSYVDVSYDPPFIYSYQCTSSILTNYASVYVLMFIMVAFLKPLLLLLMVKFHALIPKQTVFFILIDTTIHNLLKPANEEELKLERKLFHTERYVLRTVGKIAVFVTFGVVFPPLAAVLCVAFISETYLNLIIIGRFLTQIKDPLMYIRFKEQMSKDCQDCMDLLLIPLVRLVVPFAALFYGFFVFDTYGDTCGFKASVWAPVLLVTTPAWLWCGYSGYTRYVVKGEAETSTSIGRKEKVEEGSTRDTELVTVNNVLWKNKNGRAKEDAQ